MELLYSLYIYVRLCFCYVSSLSGMGSGEHTLILSSSFLDDLRGLKNCELCRNPLISLSEVLCSDGSVKGINLECLAGACWDNFVIFFFICKLMFASWY